MLEWCNEWKHRGGIEIPIRPLYLQTLILQQEMTEVMENVVLIFSHFPGKQHRSFPTEVSLCDCSEKSKLMWLSCLKLHLFWSKAHDLPLTARRVRCSPSQNSHEHLERVTELNPASSAWQRQIPDAIFQSSASFFVWSLLPQIWASVEMFFSSLIPPIMTYGQRSLSVFYFFWFTAAKALKPHYLA